MDQSSGASVDGNPFEVSDAVYIHHVPRKQLTTSISGRSRIEVPRGHAAIVVVDGEVKEILPSGVQVAVGVMDRLMSVIDSRLDRSAFYVISRRPVALASPKVQVQLDDGRTSSVSALIQLTAPLNDHSRLVTLVESLLGSAEYLEVSTLRSQFSPLVEQALRGALRHGSGGSFDANATTAALKEALMSQLGAQYGFDVSVSLSLGEPRMEVAIRLGESATPALKRCANDDCGNYLQATKKFCGKCGTQQPISTSPTIVCFECDYLVLQGKKFCGKCGAPVQPSTVVNEAVFSADGEQLQVFLSILVEGRTGPDQDAAVQGAVQAVLRRALQRSQSEELSSRQGLSLLQETLSEELRRAVSSVGGTLVATGALDVRLKDGEWVLQARAELERAKKEAMLDREWIARDNDELEVLALQYEVAAKRVNLEADHQFEQRRSELQRALRQEQMELEHAVASQGQQLDGSFQLEGQQLDHALRSHTRQLDHDFSTTDADLTQEQRLDARRTDLRDQREELLDRNTDHDVKDAQRETRSALGVDQAERQLDRALRAEDKTDKIQDLTDAREVTAAERLSEREDRAYQREIDVETRQDALAALEHEQTVDDAARDHRQRAERQTLAHEQELERKVAEQDLALRTQAERTQADNQSYVERLKADNAVYAQRQQQTLLEETADRAMARKHEDADRSLERELSAEERRAALAEQAQENKWKQMMAVAAQDDAHELATRKLEVDAEQAKLETTQSHELSMREALKGQSVDEMLAMQAGGANGGELAAALAKKFEADAAAKKAEAEAALAGNQDLSAAKAAEQAATARAEEMERSRERESASQAQMMAMMQNLMQQNQAFAQNMVQQQASVTQAALGNAQGASDRERIALQSASHQAVSMAERSMDTMARVASSAATPGATVVVPPGPQPSASVGAPAQTFVVPGPAPAAPATPAASPAATSVAEASKASAGVWACTCGVTNSAGEGFCEECGTQRP